MAVVVCFVVVCVLSLYNVQYYLCTAKEHIDIWHTSSICQWHLMRWFVAFWGWCRCRFYGSKKKQYSYFSYTEPWNMRYYLWPTRIALPILSSVILLQLQSSCYSTSLTCLRVFVLMYWVYSPVPTTCFPPSSVTTSTGTLSDFYFTLIALALLVWVSWAWTLLTFRARQIYWQADVINH